MRYRAMYKSELAEAAGVSRVTLWAWMKRDRAVLSAMGVSPHSKKLPARVVRYLDERYCIF